MKFNTNPVRGTYDYAPKDAELREEVREIILDCYRSNGFSLINTPILESLDLLNSSDGGDNLRLIFKTVKRGEKLDLNRPNLTENDITEEGLRYDLTIPLARFYANNREKLPNPFKAIQIDYSFRAERPQRGRDRQFIQCDIDEFGDESVQAEIDVISTGVTAFTKLGFDELTIKINSRQILNSIVLHAGFDNSQINSVCVTLDKFDKIGLDGIRAELTEKYGESMSQNTNILLDAVKDISENNTEAILKYGAKLEDVERIKNVIDSINLLFKSLNKDRCKCVFDISIVRGQGYYTGLIYEVYTPEFRGAIGAGGRYDKMIEKLIGINVPAVGFSIGFAPVCMLLQEKNKQFSTKSKLALFYDEKDFSQALMLKQELTKEYYVSLYKRPKNLKAQLEKLKFIGYNSFGFYKDNEKFEIKDI